MSFITLNKTHLFHNLDLISAVATKDKVAAVLKDNAYGHDLLQMAKLCSDYGIKQAVVKTIDEACKINKYFDFVLVLTESDLKQNIAANIHITINNLADIVKLEAGTKVHLKIDTGMHRNGIHPDFIKQALALIKTQGLKLFGVMSHCRSSDVLSSELLWQYQNFLKARQSVLDLIGQFGFAKPIFHFANSATIFRLENDGVFDMVRAGLATYGYVDLDSTFKQPKLKPVLQLWANKLSSRFVNAKHRIGYGGVGRTSSKQISTYDLGYGDGLFRLDGQRPFFVDQQGQSEIIGRISMDSFASNASDEKLCVIDDAKVWSDHVGTITYEILVKLSPRIRRVVL